MLRSNSFNSEIKVESILEEGKILNIRDKQFNLKYLQKIENRKFEPNQRTKRTQY